MVVWKGEIERQHGRKAYNLDNVELETPNFFVITSEEIKQLFNTKDPEKILNKSLDLEELKEAYKEVGMSSEVRNASSRARNLVGGQRDNSKVSIRVSDNGFSDFELDVGASGLEESLKTVVASYFENNSGEYPNILIQKMIEAEYTGALVKGEKDYVEVVEGLGILLEQGATEPSRYLIGEEVSFESPEVQIKVTRNPMSGDYRRKRVKEPDKPFSDSEIKQFARKASSSVKFVYKRGSFFAVDSFKPKTDINSIQEIKVSPGQMNGTLGQEITISDETLSPEEYKNGLVAAKGGYTSTDAEKARRAGKPAIFSSDREEGEKIGETVSTNRDFGSPQTSSSATDIRTIEELERSYTRDKAYIENYSEVFSFEGEEAIFDARMLPDEGLESALEYMDGEVTVLLDRIDERVLSKIVEKDFSVGVDESRVSEFESALDRVERKFILDKLRDLQ